MADFINTVDVLGDNAVMDGLIDGSITEYKDNYAETVGQYAFVHCKKLETVVLPNVTSLEQNGFFYCTALKHLDLASVTYMANNCLFVASKLSRLILRNTSGVCTMQTSNVLAYCTLIKTGTGYIYVPRALVDSYKAATNWSTYADQFRALEDYTVDGTTTGELDESKI